VLVKEPWTFVSAAHCFNEDGRYTINSRPATVHIQPLFKQQCNDNLCKEFFQKVYKIDRCKIVDVDYKKRKFQANAERGFTGYLRNSSIDLSKITHYETPSFDLAIIRFDPGAGFELDPKPISISTELPSR